MPDLFDTLAAEANRGPAALFATLASSLVERRRWHALFDLRLLEARAALGVPLAGELGSLDDQARARLDERSLAACREVGWPLLGEGAVAAAWLYLRAAAEPAEVARKLRDLAAHPPAGDEAAETLRQEIVHVALWEGIDPALGLEIVLRSQGTCNAITAYEQAVSRLPAARQEAAAAVLVDHLHREVAAGLVGDVSVHVDVSHLQSVLRIARVSTARDVIEKAWQLAVYACRLPPEATYPGEPPFEDVGAASRLFYAAQLGRDVEPAVRFFRAAATRARIDEAGTLPADTLALLLWRIGRRRAACRAWCRRPACCRRSWNWPLPATRSTCCAVPAGNGATRSRSPPRSWRARGRQAEAFFVRA